MYLSVVGGSPLQKKIVKEVAFWSGKKLLGRLASNIEINIRLKRLGTADAWCDWEDDNVRPREFSMEIRTGQSFSDLILTVCHEMVHVKQMARGELCDMPGNYIWKGKKISEELDYDEQPWEKEAYSLQFKMAKQFVVENEFSYTNEMAKIDKNKKPLRVDKKYKSNLATKFKGDSKNLEKFMKRFS